MVLEICSHYPHLSSLVVTVSFKSVNHLIRFNLYVRFAHDIYSTSFQVSNILYDIIHLTIKSILGVFDTLFPLDIFIMCVPFLATNSQCILNQILREDLLPNLMMLSQFSKPQLFKVLFLTSEH